MWLEITLLGLSMSHPGLSLLALLRRDELDWYMYSGAKSPSLQGAVLYYSALRPCKNDENGAFSIL